MNINSGVFSRNVYINEGLDYSLRIDSDYIEDLSFGITGSENILFSIKSGKVFNNLNKFIGFHKGGYKYGIKSDSSSYSQSINDTLISIDYNLNNFDNNYIYYDSKGDLSGEINLYTKYPSFSISEFRSDNDIDYSGVISNYSQKNINIFSISGQNDVNVTSFVSGISDSGDVYFSRLTSGEPSGTQFLYIDSNIGKINAEITYKSNIAAPVPNGYINVSYDRPINGETTFADVNYYWNYDSTLEVKFGYLVGSGDVYRNVKLFDAYGSGMFSGTVMGEGTIFCNNMSGTGAYSFINNEVVFNGIEYGVEGRGFMTGVVATGEFIDSFSIDAVGYEGANLCTGKLYHTITKNLIEADRGIYYRPTAELTGTPAISYYADSTVNTPTGIYTGVYEELNAYKTMYAEIYGERRMVDAKAKVRVGEKTLTGVWTIKTGLYGEDLYSLPLYVSASGNPFYSGVINLKRGLNQIKISVDYTNLYQGTNDYATMNISNGITGSNVKIYSR